MISFAVIISHLIAVWLPFVILTESKSDCDDQQTSHVASFRGPLTLPLEAPSVMCGNFCAPLTGGVGGEGEGRASMHHALIHRVCHMSHVIFLVSVRMMAKKSHPAFYQP